MTRKNVGDVMSIAVVTVEENTPYKEVVRVLAGRHVGAAPVLDRAGRVVGLVSETDLLCREQRADQRPFRFGLLASRKAKATTAGELMSKPAITITAEATVDEAARRMAEQRVTHLPVVNDNTCSGSSAAATCSASSSHPTRRSTGPSSTTSSSTCSGTTAARSASGYTTAW